MRDWEEIYETILHNEYLTINQVALIADIGVNGANQIKNDIRAQAKKEGKRLPNLQTPTDLLLEYLNKSENYYWNKYKRVLEIKKLKGEFND